jgi:hypothetical protein
MTVAQPRAYDGTVDVPRFPVLRWITAGLAALFLVCSAAVPGVAATSSFDVGDQVVVIVLVKGKGNDVAIRTWDRPTVQLESGEDVPAVDRRTAVFGTVALPLAVTIPAMPWIQHDGNGQITGGGMMPPEDFPYAGFRPGPHDVIRINAEQGAHVIVTVPASTGILQVRIGGGRTAIDGYRGANLFVLQQQGRVEISNTTTTAFAQMAFGMLSASDSSFDRIRVRSTGAHVVFEHCRTKQIEASSISGALVYDGGAFDPGLARFESQSGNIALGVASPAQLTGRSQDGHVYTSFDRRANAAVDQRGDGDVSANIGNGPLVNAISGRGNVYLYDGTLASRRAMAAEWRPVHQLFHLHKRPRIEAPSRPPAPPHARFVRARF